MKIKPVTVTFAEATRAQLRGAVVFDLRTANAFAAGHIQGSINIGPGAPHAQLIEQFKGDHPIVLVTECADETDIGAYLQNLGLDVVVGALQSRSKSFVEATSQLNVRSRVDVDGLVKAQRLLQGAVVVDVREPHETQAGMIPGAISVPLSAITPDQSLLDPTMPTFVYSDTGNRSMTAVSMLGRQGFICVSDLVGGYQAWTRVKGGCMSAVTSPAKRMKPELNLTRDLVLV